MLARAQEAEVLRAPIDAAARAEARAEATAATVSIARAAWLEHTGTDTDSDTGAGNADGPALAHIVEGLTGDLAVWAAAAAREQELVAARERLTQDEATAIEFDQDLARLDDGRAVVPATIAKIEDELTRTRPIADALDAASAQLAAVTERLTAAHDAVRLEASRRSAEAAYLIVSGRHDAARATVTDLLRRRLAGHAGELAAALVAGEPCAVCGATEHPQPASPSDEPIGDDRIAAAEHERDAAAAAESAAGDALRDAREAHAGAAARAGGESPETLEESRSQCEAAVSAARAAVARSSLLAAQRQDLLDADAAVLAERERMTAGLAEVRLSIAAVAADVASLQRTVDAARGEFPTVAERIAQATQRRDRARAVLEALEALAMADLALAQAVADRDGLVAASVFGDAADATGALRDADVRAALDARVREHEAAVRGERDRLRDLELELAGAPEDLVDLEGSRAALAAARDRWSKAVDDCAAATQIATRAADLVQRAQSAHDALGELAAESAAVTRLANTVAGRAPNTHRMTLESFVLAAELEEIVLAANLRLGAMTGGRYSLQHTDARAARGAASGLGLEVMDAYTGQTRPPHSLSGGETFLASLALALGLAEVVTARAGGVRLDTLFIDEGFGSLDVDTLELAMETLDELRQGGRTVGVISHVETMKERLTAQLLVEASTRGPSVIRQDVAVERLIPQGARV